MTMARPARGCLLEGLLGLIVGAGVLRTIAGAIFTFGGVRNQYVPTDADAIAELAISAAQLYFALGAWRWRRNGVLGLYLVAGIGAVWGALNASNQVLTVVAFAVPLVWGAVLWLAVRPVWHYFNGSRGHDDEAESESADEESDPSRQPSPKRRGRATPSTEAAPDPEVTSPKKWDCPCGTTNRPTARHCKTCGERKPSTERKCEHCGTINEIDARFCEGCGVKQLPLDEQSGGASPGTPVPRTTRTCPWCGETIRADVRRCRYCMKKLKS